MTGKHETQSIDTFTWGIADRGASIRVPLSTTDSWMGYLEDRRPASNADPYKIVKVILDGLKFADELMLMKTNMTETHEVDASKFGGLTNEELLEQYQKDAETEFDNMVDLMESKANIPSETIEFLMNDGQQ